MADDELTAVRRIRRDIVDECGADLERVFNYYEDVQTRMKESGRYKFIKEPTPRNGRRELPGEVSTGVI